MLLCVYFYIVRFAVYFYVVVCCWILCILYISKGFQLWIQCLYSLLRQFSFGVFWPFGIRLPLSVRDPPPPLSPPVQSPFGVNWLRSWFRAAFRWGAPSFILRAFLCPKKTKAAMDPDSIRTKVFPITFRCVIVGSTILLGGRKKFLGDVSHIIHYLQNNSEYFY